MEKRKRRPPTIKHTSYAFNIGNSQVECYLTVVKASKIFKSSKVSRADENPETGYQRLLSEKRAKDIAEYINEGNIIPGSIILSAQENAKISFDESTNTLTFNITENAFLVIDGQHRLYGSHEANDDPSLPICIFNGLKQIDEVQYFLDVNSTQKGVPKTLRIELTKFLAEPNSKEQIRLDLFKQLNNEPLSPLSGKMSATRSVPGKLTHVSFENAIDPIIDLPIFKNLKMEQKAKLLINFLTAFQTILIDIEGSSKRLSTATFFQAIFKNFSFICDFTMINHGNYKVDSFEEVIGGINRIDFSKFSGSNTKTISSLAEEMKSLIEINQKMNDNEGLF